MSIETCISLASLGISCYSLYKTIKSQKLQDLVNSLELKLKELELEEKTTKEPLLDVKAIKSGKNCKLVFSNVGNTTIYNINAKINEESRIHFQGYKLPYGELRQGDDFEESFPITTATPPVFEITVTWEDDEGKQKQDTKTLSI